MSAKLIIIRGLPGSGKSTLAIKLLKRGWKHFEADQYHVRNGKYNFDASKIAIAHSWCLNSTSEALDKGKTVVVSNTFTTHREVKPYIDLAEEKGVSVAIIHCIGQYESIHGVPIDVIEKMHNRWDEIDEEILYHPEENEIPKILA